jgi:hypothetical protein
MVRRDTPSNSAAWSRETLRPIRGSTLRSDEDAVTDIREASHCG